MRIFITDMQPITPATGGGRQRLLGVFGSPPAGVEAVYLGTYDWPGEKKRDAVLPGGLRELLIPLSDRHFEQNRRLQERHNYNFIDLLFHKMGRLSPEFMNHLTMQIRLADAVVFSHPWIYPLVADDGLLDGKAVIYDAHNHEAALRAGLLPATEFGQAVAAEVAAIESDLCRRADLVTCCSLADAHAMAEAYGLPAERFAVVPNGAPRPGPVTVGRDSGAGPVRAVFLASGYGPNNEAAEYIVTRCAPALPDVEFVLIGGVCSVIAERFGDLPPNVRLLGIVSDAQKQKIVAGCGLALNPIFAGSGTNVKMYDFIMNGLPVCSTEIGARGIDSDLLAASEVVPPDGFLSALKAMRGSIGARREVAREVARRAQNRYSWDAISQKFYQLACRAAERKSPAAPFISVVVPTFERAKSLTELLLALADQSFRDFEIVVVDQSAESLDTSRLPASVAERLAYYLVSERGAVAARNHGAQLARGRYLGFIDDDCLPDADWLEGAAAALRTGRWVGVEGEVIGEMLDDPDMRGVSNTGHQGMFLTANLFVERAAFWRAGGFDPCFDNPHFREDTDLGIRVAALGRWYRGREVRVFHGSHLRSSRRESARERARFFVNDAAFAQRHPQRYREVFESESQWRHGHAYWEFLLRGFVEKDVPVPDFVLKKMYETYFDPGRGH